MRRRLALVTPGFSASEQDWCIPALLDLVRVLQRDEDVTVFTLRYPHTRAPYRVYGAQVVPFGAAQARGLGRFGLWLRAARRLRKDVLGGRFDLVHALWAHEPAALGAWACRGTRVPLVVSVLGGELVALPDVAYGGQLQPLNRRLIAYGLARAARVTFGSEALLRGAAAVDAARARRLPLGVARERFHPGPPAAGGLRLDGRPCLLSVASLAPVKDHATLLRALALAGLGEARLHLVGDGAERGALERLAAELGVAPQVRFHGPLPHDVLPDVYHQADLHVVSSRFESQCLAALEAAACGTPLVGTRVGILPELLPAERLAAPGDSAGLAECLRHAARADAPREATLAALVAERYGLERAVPDLVRLYDELAPRVS